MVLRFALYWFFVSLLAANAFAKPTHTNKAMVTSANPDATNAGVQILKNGGNAIDAAIATALAISVVEPFSAGIGGGGFLLFYHSKQKEMKVLDFREVAPQLATADMFSDDELKKNPSKSSTKGHFAVAVPGTIAGLFEAHRAHGKLPWKKLFDPAISLARNGFVVYEGFKRALIAREADLKLHPASWAAFSQNGEVPVVGTLLKQPELARSLEILSRDHRAFYEGSIAKAIINEMKQNGGLINEADLRSYRPKWREPICGPFLDLRVCSMPPPSSGGILLLQLLNGVQEIGAPNLPWHSAKTIDIIARLMKRSYQDRAELLGDPAFVKIPVQELAARSYAKEVTQPQTNQPKRESEETTHLNVVDSEHNAVALTFTVNLGFGSGVVVPKTGILLNNEMDDFATQPNRPNSFGLIEGKANEIAPGKIPLSSMTPTIALKDDRFYLAAGSPGGSLIITTVFLTLLNHLVYGMNIADALASKRFHHQWRPDRILVEDFGFDPLTIDALRRMKHETTSRPSWGNASIIATSPDGGLDGAADPRGYGTAAGY